MLPTFIRDSITGYLQKQNPSVEAVIHSSSGVSGGSINQAVHLKTSHGDYFLKYNDASRFPGMFAREARGLKLLGDPGVIEVPRALLVDEDQETAFLLMEYVDSAGESGDFWDDFGKKLAALHQIKAGQYGLDHDNYMGSLYQQNDYHSEWTTFFISRRLEPQIKLAREVGRIARNDVTAFERLFKRLDEIFPPSRPSLVHGDLWSGNFMAGPTGHACLIDPAAYFGHPEIDIAMSTLFGGFSGRFYESYNRYNLLENGWRGRLDIYNLYPLMVHVNLFGGSYLGSVQQILRKF
jgi:protein-ribulosamine 3-kinase